MRHLERYPSIPSRNGDSAWRAFVIQAACWDGGQACMARPYSRDLRERVVRAVESGLSRRKAAAVFGVGIATVIDWVAVWRESGRVSANPMGGDHSSRLRDDRTWLL